MPLRITVSAAVLMSAMALVSIFDYAKQNAALLALLRTAPPIQSTLYAQRFAEMEAIGQEKPATVEWFRKMLLQRGIINQGLDLRHKDALLWYQSLNRILPDSALISYYLGATYDQQGDSQSALAQYRQGIAQVDAPDYLGSLYYRIARLYETGVNLEPIEDPTRLYELAVNNGHFVTFDDALKAHYYLAFLYQEHGEPEKAETMFEWVLRQRPTRYTDFMFLGRAAWEARQDANLAESYLQEAIQLYPDRVWAYRHLAVIQEESGRVDAARKTYEKILKLDPNDSWAASRVARP